MVQCPRCGAECSEQDVKDGRCFRCATFIPGADAGESSRTVTFHQQDARGESNILETPGMSAVADTDPGKKNLIRPQNLSPEYERRVAEEWHATIPKVGDVDDTIKRGASQAEESLDLNIGKRRVADDPTDVNADYVLLEELGKGNMGQVWSARESSLDRIVAIKIPHANVSKEIASDSHRGTEARQQFISEVVVTGRLDHPNIVPIHDISHMQNGQLFCSMKKVDGRPWNACIRLPEFTRDKNLEILMKVCDAIRYAHDKHGIIHRDLKPHNIVVGDFGEVSVMDFGLALELDKIENKHLSLAGTPAYMAPEMATGSASDIGFHTDVYLLGAILYEILTGSPPHPSPAPTESKSKWVEEVQHIVSRNEIVPTEEKGELVDVAYQALATRVSERFQTVQEFQNAIRDFFEHQKSVTLSKRGHMHLEAALRNGHKTNGSVSRFDDFDRARFAFDEAIQLWGDNRDAVKGAEKTCVEYAKYALDQQAYTQGIALLDEHNPEHTPLLSKLQKAKRQQENAANARKRLWQSVFALASMIAVGSVIAVVIFIDLWQKEQKSAKKAQESAVEAELAKLDATKSQGDAFNDRLGAKLEESKAIQAKQVADDQKGIAIRAEEEATQAKVRAEKLRDEAESSAYEAEIGLAAAEAKRNAFDNLSQSLVRIDSIISSADKETNGNTEKELVSNSVAGALNLIDDASKQFDADIQPLVEDLAKVVETTGVAELDAKVKAKQKEVLSHIKEILDEASGKDGKVELAKNQLEDNENADESKKPRDHVALKTTTTDPRGWEWGYLKLLSEKPNGVTDLALENSASNEYECVAITPDYSFAAAGTSDGKIYIWIKNESGDDFRQPLLLESGFGKVSSVALMPTNNDSCYLAIASDKGVSLLKIGETDAALSSPIELKTKQASGPASSVTFSADGKHLAASWKDGHISKWSSTAGPETEPSWKWEKKEPLDDGVHSARFSPDGQQIVTAGANGTVRVWNASNGNVVMPFSNGSIPVYTAVFMPDGKHVIAGDGEGRISIWKVLPGATAENFNERTKEKVSELIPKAAAIITFDAHDASVRSLAVASATTGGVKVFSTGNDNTLKVWELPPTLDLKSLVNVLRGHGGWVSSCALANDGKLVLSGGYDGRVRLWDWDKYKIAQILKPSPKYHDTTQQFTSVAYSQDGKWISTTTNGGLLTLWDMTDPANPRPQYPIEGHDMLATSIAPFSGGKFLLTSAGDNTTRVWESSTGREIARLGGHWQKPDGTGTGYRGIAAVSADGNLIATGSDPLLGEEGYILAKVWDWQANGTKQLLSQLLISPDKLEKGEKPEATALAFSPDGSTLLVGDQFGACRLYRISDGHLLTIFNHRGKISAAKFVVAQNTSYIFTSSLDGNVIKWKVQNDSVTEKLSVTEELQLRHKPGRVYAMDVSSDGMRVVTASVSQQKDSKNYESQIHVWDLSQARGSRLTIPEKSTEEFSGIATYLELHPQKPSVVLVTMFSPESAGDVDARYTVKEWDYATDVKPQKKRESKASEIAMATYLPNADGSSFVTIGGRRARYFVNQKTKMTYSPQGGITSGSFSPDSKSFVCASSDGTVKFWSLDPTLGTWKSDPSPKLLLPHRTEENPDGELKLTFHPTRNDILLSTGGDRTAIVWQKNEQGWDEKIVLPPKDKDDQKTINCAIFSSDGSQILTCDSDVRIWDINLETSQANGPQILDHDTPNDTPIVAIAVTPENTHQRIITAAGSDAFVWDHAIESNKPLKLHGHAADVTAVTFCEENRVATASKDQTIRIWGINSSEPKPLLTLEEHTGQVTSIAFIPEDIDYEQNDGAYLLSSGLDGQVILRPSLQIENLQSIGKTE